jgi:uncharacterized tellurite resistance protein B-like protein
MLDAIRSLLKGSGGASKDEAQSRAREVDPTHLAACALLLEVAYADGEFSAAEHTHLANAIGRHFGLSPQEGERLLGIAEEERQRAIDHFQFTRVLQQNFSLGQKMVLAEVMWGLVLSDGKIAEREDALTRKISRLLELQPGYLATAKEAAAKAAEKRK